MTSPSGNADGVTHHVIYEAFGEKYQKEAVDAARSMIHHNPRARAYLYTDTVNPEAEAIGMTTLIRQWPVGMLSKVRALQDFQEERYIWLDTDTRVCGPLDPFDRFLDRYGVSASPDPIRDARRWLPIDLGYDEHEMFPELNCGVVAVNRKLLPPGFFDEWIQIQAELAARNPTIDPEAMSDQYGLRILLGRTGVAPGLLLNELNFRACYPQTINVFPTVIHSRTPDPAFVERRLRSLSDLTMWFPFGTTLARDGTVIRGTFWLYRLVTGWVARVRGR